jgi:hypothetical protein
VTDERVQTIRHLVTETVEMLFNMRDCLHLSFMECAKTEEDLKVLGAQIGGFDALLGLVLCGFGGALHGGAKHKDFLGLPFETWGPVAARMCLVEMAARANAEFVE